MDALRAVVLAALLLAGCAPQGGREVIIAGSATPGTPGEAMWLSFKDGAEAASGGAIRMRPLIYGQLGSEEQVLGGLRRGRIHYANLSAQVVSTVVPELTLLYAPYLFDDEVEADYVYDCCLTDVYRELLAAQGLHLVTWYEIGFHHVYARDRPILLPADARGRRFRIASSLSSRLLARALGADAIPLGFADIVPSLQTGLIEAGDNSVTLYARTGIAGEAPHLTLTGHLLGMSVIVSQKAWWDSLTDAERRILTEAFPPIARSRQVSRAETARDLAGGAQLGIQVHPLDTDQRAQWRQAMAPVTAQLVEEIGGRAAEIHGIILDAQARYARER